MQKRNVVIDCDPGTDDALALLFALRSPALNVLGITTVAGNVTIERTTRNALIIVEHSGKQVPVMRGAAQPLFEPLHTSEIAHGDDGLADLYADPASRPSDEHAVDFLIRTAMESTEPPEWIGQGPLTNLALALKREPRLEQRVRSLVLMGGGLTGGNSTPAAEFNMYVDPEAADIVFRSPILKTMVALEPIDGGAWFMPEDVERLLAAAAPWAKMCGDLLKWQDARFKSFGLDRPEVMYDPAATAVAIDPTVAEARMMHVEVETQGKLTRGMTVADRRWFRDILPDAPKPNVNVVTRIDNQRYRRLFLDTLLA
jgi:pyrimidine-specific ribonucleoside hydrolase